MKNQQLKEKEHQLLRMVAHLEAALGAWEWDNRRAERMEEEIVQKCQRNAKLEKEHDRLAEECDRLAEAIGRQRRQQAAAVDEESDDSLFVDTVSDIDDCAPLHFTMLLPPTCLPMLSAIW